MVGGGEGVAMNLWNLLKTQISQQVIWVIKQRIENQERMTKRLDRKRKADGLKKVNKRVTKEFYKDRKRTISMIYPFVILSIRLLSFSYPWKERFFKG